MEQIKYKEISNMNKWRVPLIKELIDMKHGDLSPPDNWTFEELEEIFYVDCIPSPSCCFLSSLVFS
jgi:hypothetical protein